MRRTEDIRFVTGRGCYVGDFTRPGLSHAVIVATGAAAANAVAAALAPLGVVVRDLPLSAANIARRIRDAQRPA